MDKKPIIGCIGQGWIGKNYANDFESRGYTVVRYGLEPEYTGNKAAILDCDIVFIAVPTPTTREGFDASIVRSVLPLVGKDKTVVIKSTLLPGTTEELQKGFPNIIVLNSPEFLQEVTASYDASHPSRNLIGMPEDSARHRAAAEAVLAVLPPAPFAKIMSARAAELTKYAGNVYLATKVVFANMLYDLTETLGIDYQEVREALGADPRIGTSHLAVMSASGHSTKAGRGAGGHCFIKDLEAFRRLYDHMQHDPESKMVLDALVRKNNALLVGSEKDIDLLTGVYSENVLKKDYELP